MHTKEEENTSVYLESNPVAKKALLIIAAVVAVFLIYLLCTLK
jgi:hypothetical protein